MAKRKRNRFVNQAALEALVRFGPELSGLKELQRQAEENFVTGVKQAHGTARGIIGAVDQARPQVAKVYDSAGLQQAKTASMVGTDIAALKGVAPSIAAGAQLEAAGAATRLGDARAAALTDLSSRKVAAKEGETFAVNNARSEFIDAVTKVLNRKRDLGGEQGAFTISTARELETAAQGRADKLKINADDNSQSERNSLRSAGINPDTGKAIPGGKADPKAKAGPKPASREAHVKVQDVIDAAVQEATTFKAAGAGRGEVEELLLKGAEKRGGEPRNDPQTGKPLYNKDGTRKTTKEIPGVEPVKSKLLLDVALDVSYDGHLSKRNQALLHKRGLSVKDLGLPTYGEWAKKERERKRRQGPAGARVQRPRSNRYGPNG